MSAEEPNTEQLLGRAAGGDPDAGWQALERQRGRLRRMIAVRLDRRLAARVDPSDVVQETLAGAYQRLPDYLRARPLPFHAWLRQMAQQRLVELHRHHVQARRRSVTREEADPPPLPDGSALELIDRLLARGSSPSAGMARREQAARVQAALAQLAEHDREVLVLRHLEQLSPREIAGILGVSEGVVYTRHLRALRRLQHLLTSQ
jgi:RNA polymerase sigma-70 factor (ECF subfamily)